MTIALAIVIFILLEVALQARSHIRFGKSVFNTLSETTTFVVDPKTGLLLLRPNAIIEGSQATIKTNSLGLRDDEVDAKPEGEFRIAILGASSVMGTYTKNNSDTISAKLNKSLTQNFPEKKFRVINAGIAGLVVYEQIKLLDEVIRPLNIDLLVWYPGFNDMTGYCLQKLETRKSKNIDYKLPKLQLPSWLLSIDLLIKNTVELRTTAFQNTEQLDPSTLDTSRYTKKVNQLLDTAEKLNVPTLVVTNARAFRTEMPEEEQYRLSETSRYYNNCFDLKGINRLFDDHNLIIEKVAKSRGYPVLNLNEKIPGGDEYFGDATHFTVKGTQKFAETLEQKLITSDLIPH
ncbi:hypothetical protein Q4567_00615 [Aliiglaciecola sp. 2_MG-2023]|uniref:SGNH/GDSL hydrolase family protein n=1 Tax=unclassified Aliiglaciecola TaxID=2593648 RepID=UPI0026E1E2D9|nr:MULTISPECIES: hypothetical protein [unclassified Aliiglaciecola]MDO6709211.1 hypothetical protein [Aliiglaciecola sp. 2_MG-2023]MDO6750359.1 hypothetical protein [Aliiglaciecola sp. 1_MG-2023]